MGMDYEYAGSASYPRFDAEVKQLVQLFGGVETEQLQKLKLKQQGIEKMFGYMSSAPDDMQKYYFPIGTDEKLAYWFNNIYERFSPEDTKIIWGELQKKVEEANLISSQIIHEFINLTLYNEGWHIS